MVEVKIKESSNIKSMFYDDVKKELLVFFNSMSLYVYKDISHEDFAELKKADENIGKIFYEKIRNNKKYEKIY